MRRTVCEGSEDKQTSVYPVLVLINRLGNLPRNSVVRLNDHLDMAIVVDWDVNSQMKQINEPIVKVGLCRT